MIRCALFDIGNVLLFFSHDRMERQLAEVYGCTPREVHLRLFESGLVHDYDRGRISTEELFAALSAGGVEVDYETAREAASRIFEPNEEIVPVVEALKKDGVRLLLLSNTCEVHSSYFLKTFEHLQLFDDRVFSHEVGYGKPEGGIYRAALLRSGCAASECFFVDDIPEYVDAAAGHGMKSAVYTDVPTLLLSLQRVGVDLSSHGLF